MTRLEAGMAEISAECGKFEFKLEALFETNGRPSDSPAVGPRLL